MGGTRPWGAPGHGRAPSRLLPAGALAVRAPWPATGPTLAFFQLLLGAANAAFSRGLLLGIFHPADELVAGQRCDVLPGIERRGVGDQRLAQVSRKLVYHPTGHSKAAHGTTVASQVATGAQSRSECEPNGSSKSATLDVLSTASSPQVPLETEVHLRVGPYDVYSVAAGGSSKIGDIPASVPPEARSIVSAITNVHQGGGLAASTKGVLRMHATRRPLGGRSTVGMRRTRAVRRRWWAGGWLCVGSQRDR